MSNPVIGRRRERIVVVLEAYGISDPPTDLVAALDALKQPQDVRVSVRNNHIEITVNGIKYGSLLVTWNYWFKLPYYRLRAWIKNEIRAIKLFLGKENLS